MPELPEVETIRRSLAQRLVGKKIAALKISDIRVLQGFAPDGAPRRRCTAGEMEERLLGDGIRDVLRRGKYLIFDLDSGRSFLCHLRMTGQLLLGSPDPRARAQFIFEGTND